ncbi:flagellar biosynthetic protein FliO [Arthrobacter sp. UKPF54-2]|uniref:flagellar biosynthetic protein FliO n=1 Tax=Arthrobacter sp. UKPF54-2 TaxID=2600159 RepID=UPI0011B19FA3|nr:flagellar biosynthetic protein FliO [Arthrobacter sp. UKPF54-2]QDY89197.1 flagellar biosynthetic protein FliO [Arthrobacter sp. UKPF54-2]
MDSLILGLRVAVALGAVLGLIWLLQRRLGKGPGRRRADAALSVVSRQSLGQRASVVVVDAGGHRFLLGVTDHAVNVLHTGDIPEEALEDLAPEPRRGGAAGAFAQILAGASTSASASANDAVSANDADADAAAARRAADATGVQPGTGAAQELPLSRRSSIHRDSHARTSPGRTTPGRDTGSGAPAHPPLHGSILAGSTWKQAAAALRSGRRN